MLRFLRGHAKAELAGDQPRFPARPQPYDTPKRIYTQPHGGVHVAVYKGREVCPREVDLGDRAWKPAQACLGREHQESVLDREAWLRGGQIHLDQWTPYPTRKGTAG